jgi:AraC family transcriptional regulator, transcriptional activator of pobA
MQPIPVSTIPEHGHELRVLPLGDFTPYDFGKPHRHTYFEFFIFDTGGGSHFIDFIEYPIREQSVHIVFPQQIHLVKRSATANGYVMICSRHFMNLLDKLFYTQLLNHNYTHPCLSPGAAAFTDIAQLVPRIQSELRDGGPMAQQLAQNYTSIFLSLCIRHTPQQAQEEISHTGYSTHDLEIYRRFTTLLDEHFGDKQQVGFYASALSLSTKVLNNCIRKVVDKTCAELLQERSLLEAKRLLLYTDESIKEIAFRLGFQDSSYFTRFFARMEHKTPKEFKQYWEEKYHS